MVVSVYILLNSDFSDLYFVIFKLIAIIYALLCLIMSYCQTQTWRYHVVSCNLSPLWSFMYMNICLRVHVVVCFCTCFCVCLWVKFHFLCLFSVLCSVFMYYKTYLVSSLMKTHTFNTRNTDIFILTSSFYLSTASEQPIFFKKLQTNTMTSIVHE